MDAGGGLAGRDLVAGFDEGFDEAGGGGVDEVVGAADVEHAGGAGAGLVGGEDADVGEGVAEAAFGDAEGCGGDGAAAAEFGAEAGLAGAEGCAGGGADGALAGLGVADVGDGGGEGAEGGDVAGLAGGVGVVLHHEGGGDVVEGGSAGVEVDHDVGAGDQLGFDEVGDLLGDGAHGVTGEEAVEVAVVNGGGAGAGDGGGEIGGGQEDDPALDRLGREGAGEVAEGDLAFVFVAVGAGDEECGRAFAVVEDDDWDGDVAVGGAVDGVEEADEAALGALLVEVDFGDQGGLHGASFGGVRSGIRASSAAMARSAAGRSFIWTQ